MAHRSRNFRQRDITAAVKAVKAAGENIAEIRVDPDGRLTLYIGSPTNGRDPVNPWKAHLDAQEIAVRSKLRRV